jgi:hypothetical protein
MAARLPPTLTFAFAVVLQTLASGQRAPVVQTVDLAVQTPPVMFAEAGGTRLVYELHVTNFLTVDVSLTRVRITAGAGGRVIADYQGDALQRAIVRPGLSRDHQTPHVVGPGMRAVVNFWTALPANESPPQSVAHAVDLDVLRPSGAVHAVAEGGGAAVSTERAVVLDPPLRGGPWIAIYDPALKGGHRTAIYTIAGGARIPGRFAIDWIALPPEGAMASGEPRPADWNGFGSEVLAVADGVVAAAEDGVADHTPSPVPLEIASGNYVAIDLGRGRFAFYEHLKQDSVAVKAGERVRRGQVVARLGASGSSSIGPHLHFHVADANSTLGAEGLPFVFRRFDHLGAFASIDALRKGEKWAPGASGGTARTRERPAANSVVRFR